MSKSISASLPETGQYSQLAEGLASSGLCANLGTEAVLALSRLARQKTYAALQEAVTEGQTVSEIEIVTSGRFVVLLPSAQIDLHASGSFNLHLYLAGDCFGLSGLAGIAPASVSVIASDASSTISIPIAGFRRVLDGDDSSAAIVYRNLFAMQSRRLDALSAQ